MIKTSHFLLCTLSFVFISACSQPEQASVLQEAWNPENAPENVSLSTAILENLPMEGGLSEEAYAWSDDYWGTYSGGISRRWQYEVESRDYKDHIYEFVTRDQVKAGLVDIAKLSPAEKYDLLMGDYDFPLARHERERMLTSVDPSTDSIPTWFGLCHGWAPATIMEPEAGKIATVKNSDGIEIPFYTSDIKALMTKIYSDYNNSYRGAGERCNLNKHDIEFDSNGRIVQPECRDLNPGTLHLALAKMLGDSNEEARKGFVLDVTYTSEVWNQAVVGFRVKEKNLVAFDANKDALAKYRARETATLAKMRVEIDYIVEIAPHMQPMKMYKKSYTSTMELEYVLELNADGEIIGGEWVSEERPDFLWLMAKKPETGNSYINYDSVRQLLDQSRESAE